LSVKSYALNLSKVEQKIWRAFNLAMVKKNNLVST